MEKMKRTASFLRRAGFTLIEMAFVLAIIGLITVAASREFVSYLQSEKARQLADEGTLIMGGVNAYVAENFEQLIKPAPVVTGVAAPLAPTIAELRTIGKLAAGVKDTNVANTGWRVVLSKQPVGCVYPNCDIAALLLTNSGVTAATGAPDNLLAATAAEKVGANGLSSSDQVPGTLSGRNNDGATANPLGNVQAVFAVRGGFGASGFSQFVRQGDSRNITLGGGLTVNGAPGVTVANNLTASNASISGTTTTGTVSATTANVTGSATISGTMTAGTANVAGTLTANAATVTNSISTQYVNFTTPAGGVVAGGACSPDGKTGKDSTGALFSCTNGFWSSTSTKPCVHGSWTSTLGTAGTYTVYIPQECKTVVAYGSGGGGSGGMSGQPSFGYGGGGGGAATVYNNITYTLPTGASGTYTVTVGDGGAATSIWDCGYWTLCHNGAHVGNPTKLVTVEGTTVFSWSGGAAGAYSGGGARGAAGSCANPGTGGAGQNGTVGANGGGAGGAGRPGTPREWSWADGGCTAPGKGGAGGGDGGDSNGTTFGGGGGGASACGDPSYDLTRASAPGYGWGVGSGSGMTPNTLCYYSGYQYLSGGKGSPGYLRLTW